MVENYLNILKKYNIKSFYHFTNIINLESILIYGICNREYMDNNGIVYRYTDENRYDNQKKCISFSLESTNKYMLSYKRKSLNNDWIIIEFDAYKLVSNYYKNMYFCKYNAATPAVINLLKNNKNYLNTFKAFDNMFDNGKLDNQAEVLLEGNVLCSYINKIYVDSLQNKLIVQQILSDYKYDIEVIIKREMF